MRDTGNCALRRLAPLLLLPLAVASSRADEETVAPARAEIEAPATAALSLPPLPELPAAVLDEPPTDPLLYADGPLDPETLLRLAQHRVAALGPLSIGTPDAGLLVNPVQMPDGPYWTIRNKDEAWGTDETVAFVVRAIESVEARYPGSPRLAIGDLSRADGGRLNRHRSHQAGRDVDLGFYYLEGERPEFLNAHRKNLDLPRTWALVRALIGETDVERIFVDRSIIPWLHAYARDVEQEDPLWLDDVFGRLGPQHKGIIQHERGHRNHLHVRFFNSRAQEAGRIVYPALVAEGVAPPPKVRHKVRRGETIGHLARRYGTSATAIRQANGLRGSLLRAGRSYLIPIRRLPEDAGPIVVPPRRLPPGAAMAQAVDALPQEMAEDR